MTLNGYFNYGNRLQNYALQEAIELLGFEAETVLIKRDTTKSVQMIIFNVLKNIKYKVANNKAEKCMSARIKIFKEFSTHYIAETPYTLSINKDNRFVNNKYDYFVVGSDQVWNPEMNRTSQTFFLDFAESKKKIAYAPSFGTSEVPENIKDQYGRWINDIKYLSVREDDGAKIIRDLTGREAPVLVDPTLLLSKEKWLSISKEASNKPKEKYLLTYFLGGIPDNYRKQISNVVKKNNLKVINLGDIKEKETYRTGPSEFIDYINCCSVFCTDSFHGAVFSILLEKPFIVFERQGLKSTMFSRINTLLDKFNLENRKAENICWNEEVFSIDYSGIPKVLETERNKSFTFLKEALNVKEK